MNIGIDLDGVLADQMGAVLPIIEREHGVRFRIEEIVNWDFLWQSLKISVSALLEMMEEAWFTEMSLLDPEALVWLRGLQTEGHRICIISKRTRKSFASVCEWLDRNSIVFDDLIFVGRGRNKLEFPIDCLVDDSPYALKGAAAFPDKMFYLRTQPWNARENCLKSNVVRVNSLSEACRLIQERRSSE